MDEAINLILNEVKYVPKCGAPGNLIVFGPNAFPILTGNDCSSVVFAAATFGNGRLFVTSHELYLTNLTKYPKNFSNLWQNIKKWLTNGQQVDDENDIKNIDEFASCSQLIKFAPKIVTWLGSSHKNEIFVDQFLKNYVQNGGAVLCGLCPWGWLSKTHGKTLQDLSLNKFLSQFGVCFSLEQAKIDRVYIKTSKNKALESHLSFNIDKLENDMKVSLELKNYFIDSIESLPNELTFEYLERLHKVLYKFITLNFKPTFNSNISSPVGRALLIIASKLYLKYSICGIVCRAPSIEEFPSFTLLQPKTVSTTLFLKSKHQEFHFTGYYVPPGIKASINLLEGNSSGWEVRIGAHTDQLTNVNLKRWPCISSNFRLRKKLSITTAFGGLIYLQSPKGSSSIKVKLDSVVEAPFYDLTKPETINNWPENQQSSSPWSELSGKHISFCVPSICIRKLCDPSEVLDIWDKLVQSNHELRGTNVNNTWRERVVVDIQPSGGLIHAGYPIVLFYSYSSILFDKNKIKFSCWSLVHELGHNIQRSCWVPDGTIEALANLYAYHAFEVVFNQKAWYKFLNEKHNESRLLNFAEKGFTKEEWLNNCNLPLYLYMQLQKSFGWNSFRILFREYEVIANSKELFKNDRDKWNEFIMRFSNIVGLNVVPLFIFWGIDFSDKINDSLSDLTAWLPNDEITRLFPDRVKFCRKNFNFMLFGNESLYSTFHSD